MVACAVSSCDAVVCPDQRLPAPTVLPRELPQEVSSVSALTSTTCMFEESKLTVKERLLALFSVYSPNALMTIDPLLEEYKGRERALFRMLGRKFHITTDQALSIGAWWAVSLPRTTGPPVVPLHLIWVFSARAGGRWCASHPRHHRRAASRMARACRRDVCTAMLMHCSIDCYVFVRGC